MGAWLDDSEFSWVAKMSLKHSLINNLRQNVVVIAQELGEIRLKAIELGLNSTQK